jgi:hypothetical protein
MKIVNNSIISKKERPLSNDIDGETVMMSTEQGKYFGLNTVASTIWDILDQPIRFGDIIEKLMTKYKIDEDTCIKETLTFLEQLNEHNLISIETH